MSLLKLVLAGFAIVMIPVAVTAIAMFLQLPSPIPSLISTTVFLLEFHYIMHVRKQEKKAEQKIDRSH